ncbi:hypothetical protein [Evansella tamaricis]|nr:hypothetical protein [Evansella tamaricis]
MPKKLLLSLLSVIFALGFMTACGDMEGEPLPEDDTGFEDDLE